VRHQAAGETAGEGELRAVVTTGLKLLARAVRASWDRGVLTKSEKALLPTELTVDVVEWMVSRVESAPAGEPPPEATPVTPTATVVGERPPLPRLRGLCQTIADRGAALAEDVLAVLLAIELDATARSLASYLRGGAGSAITVGPLVLAVGEERTPELLMAIGAGAPLRRHRLVEVQDKAGELVAAATVRAAPRVLRWLVDPVGLDDEVAEFASLFMGAAPELTPAAIKSLDEIIDGARAFIETQRAHGRALGDLVLRGARGAGRSEVAREACRRLGLPVLAAPVGAILGQPQPAEAVAALLREAVLLDAQLVLEGGESLSGADEVSARVRTALGASTRPLLITSSSAEQSRLAAGRKLVLRDVPIAPTHVRESIWREVLPDVPSEEVASLYRVGAGAIARCADGARLRAEVRGAQAPSHADVAGAVRAEFETDLGTVATRVDVSQTWEDLVVPDDTGRTIAELVDQLRHRSTVLGRWGFQRKLGKGLGTTALFSGEPGTGKSMVAGLIARELGLELYQIDLSRVLSKWIGETEKNLSKVFDAAETGHVVLLFDEADALMGKRTADVKGANDRYANIETNYILQRLEQFHGVAILTSNLESSIDPALSRRLSFELRFPFPDEEQRAEIWKRMLPAELPIIGEIDYKKLATRFELAGGHIRNIVLRAAYLAASDSGGLSMDHLLRAAEYEYRDHGMLVARGRLST
jgi:hypothetical protein